MLPLGEMQKMTMRKGRVTGFSVILENADEDHLKAVKQAIEDLHDEKGKSLRLAAISIRN